MPRRVNEDHKDFRDVYGGIRRKELKKYIKNGSIFRKRGKDGKVVITIPRIDIPHIVYGEGEGGVGKGEGEEGEVIGRDPQKGGKGNKAGQDEAEGMEVAVDMDEVLDLMKEELELPDMKPKPSDTYELIVKKYNNISLVGPESLRHNARTIKEALKRQCSDGSINKLHQIPGFAHPVRMITPVNGDKRYRQFNEVRIPSSSAVIFFARDGSASMDQQKCDAVSDMCWWIECWIKRFYEKVERVYVWHDTVASEVDEKRFYKYRYGGGTTCSSALRLISDTFENRFNPLKWNIYLFYFTDGENWDGDNEVFLKTLQDKFSPDTVNLNGIVQVMPWRYDGSLKQFLDDRCGMKNVKTTQIPADSTGGDDRDARIRKAIVDIIGKDKSSGGYWSPSLG